MLKNKVAVVTGGAGILGPVWVKGLLDAGATVAAITYPGTENDPKLQELKNKELHIFTGDVTKREDLDNIALSVYKKFGPPDVLVTSAGIDCPPKPGQGLNLLDSEYGGYEKVLDVNLLGVIKSIQAFGKYMIKAQKGSIIAIGSLYASVSPDERFYDHIEVTPTFLKHPAYGASKAGVLNLVKYYATHLAKYNIRVNALSPGGVFNNQDEKFLAKFSARVPLGRMAQKNELVQPMLFLATDASSYVTGQNLKVDGGFTIW